MDFTRIPCARSLVTMINQNQNQSNLVICRSGIIRTKTQHILFQVVVSCIPTKFSIEGGKYLGYDNITDCNNWQWLLTNSTALRSDPTYSKVGCKIYWINFQLGHNLYEYVCLFTNLNMIPLLPSWAPVVIKTSVSLELRVVVVTLSLDNKIKITTNWTWPQKKDDHKMMMTTKW